MTLVLAFIFVLCACVRVYVHVSIIVCFCVYPCLCVRDVLFCIQLSFIHTNYNPLIYNKFIIFLLLV